MAETKQLGFTLKEAATVLLKSQNIREGKWSIGFEISFVAGNIGPTADTTAPGAIIQIKSLVISRQPQDAPELPYVVDAAEIFSEPEKS